MTFLEKIKKLINRVYRSDTFVNVLLTPVGSFLLKISLKITAIRNNIFFDSLDEDGCKYFENLMEIPLKSGDTIENRRAKIQAKWLSNNHNCIALIQAVCDSWKRGEVEADFKNGKISIKFVGSLGVPEDLDSLKDAINEIKPAHLAYEIIFKYLLKRDIHHVLTKAEMQTYKKGQYCNVKIGGQ